MRDFIIINGKNSNTVEGLLIQSLPPITKPAMRTQITEVDGRDGDLVTNLGYSAYDRPVEIGLFGNFNIDEVTRYFNQRGTVVFSNEPEKRYDFTLVDEINYEKLLRYRTASVVFHVQPFKHEASTPVNVVKGTRETPLRENEPIDSACARIKTVKFMRGTTIQDGTPTMEQGVSHPVYPKTITNYDFDLQFKDFMFHRKHFIFSQNEKSKKCEINLGGDQITPFFLGSIGSNIDLLFKDGEDYKVAKKVGVSIYYHINSYDEVVSCAYAKIAKPEDFKGFGNRGEHEVLCSHATWQQSSGSPSGHNSDIAKIFTDMDDNNFVIGFPVPTGGQTELESMMHGLVIYYPTLSQTVESAPGELIESLSNLAKMTTYAGETVFSTDFGVPVEALLVDLEESSAIINAGNVNARPKLTIEGSGALDIYTNDGLRLHVASGWSSPLTIDTEQMEAYDETGYQDWKVSGSYEDLNLAPGTDGIIIDGNVNKLTVENYSRWI